MMRIYACYNKNEDVRLRSSSGGVYYAMASSVISQGGVVYAACYKGLDVVHERIDNIANLDKSMGSKYSQSDIGDCYKFLMADLKDKHTVLFVGTPCQCKAVKSYVRQDYENLILTEVVCHGVPSPQVFKSYINEQKILQPVSEISMREKSSGWSNYNYSWKLSNSDEEMVVHNSKIPFMRGFVNDLYLRPSCYSCDFKGGNTCADLTLGDFWGVWNILPFMDDNKGTSVVFVYTDRGISLLNSIMDNLVSQEISDYESVVKYNPSIKNHATRTSKRDVFFKHYYATRKVEESIDTALKKTLLERIFRKKTIPAATSEKLCVGCSACRSICPSNAISMIPDKEGFLYPHVERNKCIDCKMCKTVCPAELNLPM